MTSKQRNAGDTASERSPLLRESSHQERPDKIAELKEDDKDHPRAWDRRKKLINVAVISCMAVLSPIGTSMFLPGLSQIAQDLKVDKEQVISALTGYTILLGIGPLILAPMSETLGRRKLYLVCFSIFTLLQIPTALSPNLACLVTCRTLAGFFGSVGIANGGGSLNDMFIPAQRATIFGYYLLGVLTGPSLGPLLGSLIIQFLGWRAVFWTLFIMCSINTTIAFFFLKETYAPVLLEYRRQSLSDKEGVTYKAKGQDDRPLIKRILLSMRRPFVLLLAQPIVFIVSLYQAIIFSTVFSLFTQMQAIFGDRYGFETYQVGLLYLPTGLGFLVAVLFLVPKIDVVFNALTKRNNGESKPEFRLPLAGIGCVCVPASLFWLGWCVEKNVHWAPTIASTFFLGLGQVSIFNSVQNYYIDAYSKYAASAIAAGTVFRSIAAGIVPLFAGTIFERLGYGWGFSAFGFAAVLLAPSPLLFYLYGERIRNRFAINLD